MFQTFQSQRVSLSVLRTLVKGSSRSKSRNIKNTSKKRSIEQKKEIRTIFLGAIKSLIFALEAKDKYTAGHSHRVTNISVAIGKDLGISLESIEDLRWASLLHDVGKIAVDQLIQNTAGKTDT
jgi:HD-GYP domain-containing protein (c-di-GMP phosphodiesterase class II)